MQPDPEIEVEVFGPDQQADDADAIPERRAPGEIIPRADAVVSSRSHHRPQGLFDHDAARRARRGILNELYPATHRGQAEFLMACDDGNSRYCHQEDTWYCHDGTRLEPDRLGMMERKCNAAARERRLAAADLDDPKDIKNEVAFSYRCESASAVASVIRQARSLPGIPVLPEELDGDPWILNCRNGVVDLRNGQIRPHSKADLVTKIAGTFYDPRAECPTWEKFLSHVMGENRALIDYLRRAAGYSLSGSVREQVFFLLHGIGANGKSTFVETLRLAIGDYSQKADFETFLEKKRGDGPRNDLARMKGARFVYASEANEGRRLDEAAIKELTGGDTITARRLYEESIDFKPTHKIWVAANHKPTIWGTDEGIWRRPQLIPFSVVIPREQRDKTLPLRLEMELPGILAWAVRGCLEWQQQGLNPPAEVQAAMSEYRQEMDVLAGFLADQCVCDPREGSTVRCLFSELYAAYERWAESAGEVRLERKKFGSRLTDRGFLPGRGHSNKPIRIGIRPKTDFELSVGSVLEDERLPEIPF